MPALPGSAQCDAFHTARSRADLVARMYAAETGADCPVEIGASSCRDWPLPGLITERLSMRPGQLLVDAGCGTGASASGRPVPWPCAWTASASPRSLSTRPPRAAHFLASAHTRATFRVADLQNTALPTSATHGIVCIGALGRARDRDQAVAELGRVLGPGGQLVTTRPPVSLPPWVPTRQSSAVWPASAPSSLPAPPRHLALRPSCGHGGWDCFPPPTRSAPTVQNSASAPPGLASWPAPTGPH